MNARESLTFDANMLVYAADIEAGERHRVAKELLRSVRRPEGVLTIQALAEFYTVTTRKGLLPPAVATGFVRGWCDVYKVVSVDDVALFKAIKVVQKHKISFWDGMLWAAADRAGCSVIVTENMQNLRELEGILILNPFTPEGMALLAPYLRRSDRS